jgi:glucose/arabinose dehydrogenase
VNCACLLAVLAWPRLAAAAPPAVVLETVATGIASPTAIAHAGDARLFVTSQAGKIWLIEGGQVRPEPFLDLSDRVTTGQVQGLLGLAFHPDYPANGTFFVNYTGAGGASITSRFSVTADPNLADPASEAILLQIPVPIGDHNGGQLQFGPDGYLYVALGDGGGAQDPFCNAQSDSSLLGKLLRLDVNQNAATPPYYGIPAGNPFAGPGDPPDEVWAKGLRNPWRFTFDRATGDLYIADVGEQTREEIDLEPAASPGGRNYGWKVIEGTHCLGDTAGCAAPVPACGSPAYTPPILEYAHGDGGCSVIGGYVYRGGALPGLIGSYVFGDYCSGQVWAATESGGVWQRQELAVGVFALASFGEDVAGELYLAGLGGVYKLVPAPPPAPCQPSDTVLCLQGDRFELSVTWRTPQGGSGPGHAVPLTDESGYFWFFRPGNAEVLAKLIDACGPPYDRFWFFAAGLTNVEVEFVLLDTASGEERRYTNPLSTAFQAIQDTAAFATCP